MPNLGDGIPDEIDWKAFIDLPFPKGATKDSELDEITLTSTRVMTLEGFEREKQKELALPLP